MTIDDLARLCENSEGVQVVCPLNGVWDEATTWTVDRDEPRFYFCTQESGFAVTNPIHFAVAVRDGEHVSCLRIIDSDGRARYVRFMFSHPIVESGNKVVLA